jgi:Uma2 family endonuclease
MNAPIVPVLLEPDDLLRMPDSKKFELIDGIPMEKDMGARSGRIALRLGGWLEQFCTRHNLGYVFDSSTGYHCFPGRPRLLRIPDVSFVRIGRFPNEDVPDGFIPLAPDLVVEVISPNDRADEVETKVTEYRSAGVPLIWVVYPSTRTIHIRRLDGSTTVLTEADTLSGEAVVPGFACRVGELFA